MGPKVYIEIGGALKYILGVLVPYSFGEMTTVAQSPEFWQSRRDTDHWPNLSTAAIPHEV